MFSLPDVFPSIMEYLSSAFKPMSLSLANTVKNVALGANASDTVIV